MAARAIIERGKRRLRGFVARGLNKMIMVFLPARYRCGIATARAFGSAPLPGDGMPSEARTTPGASPTPRCGGVREPQGALVSGIRGSRGSLTPCRNAARTLFGVRQASAARILLGGRKANRQ